MAQVFRDCHRAAESRKRPVVLMQSLARDPARSDQNGTERTCRQFKKGKVCDEQLAKRCIGVIWMYRNNRCRTLAFALHTRAPGLVTLFGYALDAMIVTGVIGNFIVFLLVKTTKLNPLRAALWTFLMVHALSVIAMAIIGSLIDPQIRLGVIVIGYVVSFLFWYGVHWMWAQTKGSHRLAGEDRQ